MPSLVPAPYIQTYLRALGDRHTRVNNLFVPSSVRVEVHPEHRTAFACSKRDTVRFGRVVTFEEFTPSLIMRPIEPWKVRLKNRCQHQFKMMVDSLAMTYTTSFTTSLQIDHERARAPRGLRRRTPIIMV